MLKSNISSSSSTSSARTSSSPGGKSWRSSSSISSSSCSYSSVPDRETYWSADEDDDRHSIILSKMREEEGAVADPANALAADVLPVDLNASDSCDSSSRNSASDEDHTAQVGEKSMTNQITVKMESVELTDDYGREGYSNLFDVLPYDSRSEVPLHYKALWKETTKVKKKLFEMFDFLEEEDCFLEKNKEKFARQKARLSALCDNWESFLIEELSARYPENHPRLPIDMERSSPMADENYINLINEERLRYLEENSKLRTKYCLVVDELREVHDQLNTLKRPQLFDGFCKRGLVPANESGAVAVFSKALRCVSDDDNLAFDYKISKIKGEYEKQILATEEVIKSLEEQNRLVNDTLAMLQSENENIMAKYKILEQNEQHLLKIVDGYTAYGAGVTAMEETDCNLVLALQKREDALNEKNKWLLRKEEELHQEQNRLDELSKESGPELVSQNMELQNKMADVEKQLTIASASSSSKVPLKDFLQLQFENKELLSQVTKANRAAAAFKEKARRIELNHQKAIQSTQVQNQKWVAHELQNASDTVKVLTSELNDSKEKNESLTFVDYSILVKDFKTLQEKNARLEESNKKLQMYKNDYDSIVSSINSVRNVLAEQKNDSLKLLQMVNNGKIKCRR